MGRSLSVTERPARSTRSSTPDSSLLQNLRPVPRGTKQTLRSGTRTSRPPFARTTSPGDDEASVLVGHVENLLPGVVDDLLRMVGRDMRLHVLDQLIVQIGRAHV